MRQKVCSELQSWRSATIVRALRGFLGGYAFCTLDWRRIRLVSAVQFLYLEFGKIPSINEFHYRARFFARATKRDWIEMSLRVYFLILPLWICICGCAKWEAPEIPQRSIFPESRIAPDAIGMEVALAQLDSCLLYTSDAAAE